MCRHARITKRSKIRCCGETLISVLIAALLVGFITLELVGLLTMQNTQGNFLWARSDALNSAYFALQSMGRRVRSARNLGELYGVTPPPSQPVLNPSLPTGPQQNPGAVDGTQIPVASIEDGTAALTAATFPSQGDPLYGPGGTMTVATWPWAGGPNSPYTLSSTTLVLQVPTFDSNGFPLCLPPAFTGAPPLTALDTYVYNLVPDPDPQRAGQYALQMAYFPAPKGLTNAPPGIQPGAVTTVLAGIVGPTDGNGNPSIFQYIDKNLNTATATVDPLAVQNYTGVIVNLEISAQDASGHATVIPLRTELYMRNNVAATTIGAPPPS